LATPLGAYSFSKEVRGLSSRLDVYGFGLSFGLSVFIRMTLCLTYESTSIVISLAFAPLDQEGSAVLDC
jgi:hypothetical protein